MLFRSTSTAAPEKTLEELLDEVYGIAKNISIGLDKNPKDSLWDYDTPQLSFLKSKILKIVS